MKILIFNMLSPNNRLETCLQNHWHFISLHLSKSHDTLKLTHRLILFSRGLSFIFDVLIGREFVMSWKMGRLCYVTKGRFISINQGGELIFMLFMFRWQADFLREYDTQVSNASMRIGKPINHLHIFCDHQKGEIVRPWGDWFVLQLANWSVLMFWWWNIIFMVWNMNV